MAPPARPALRGALPAQAQEAPGWSFTLTPYLWAAGISGEAALPRRTRDFEADFGDLVEDRRFAAMGAFEARHRRFGLVLDAMTLSAAEGFATPRGALLGGGEAALDVVQLGLLGFHRVARSPRGSLDLGAGLRASWIESRVTLEPGLAAGRAREGSSDFVDPILALRGEVALGGGWSLLGHADFGGFGVGSRFTWQLLGAVSWRASESVTLLAGYRALGVDADRGGVALDVTPGGPLLGVSFRF
jgi:hypothetical protein